MIPEFQNLTEEEVDLMYKVPALVCILIAGADNRIDGREVEQAILVARMKQTRARKALIDYYQEVGKNFKEQLSDYIESLPTDGDERNKWIFSELGKINPILKKVEKNFAIKFYASMKDVAKKIAEASGGVLGLLKISHAESKLISLPMIKDPSR